MRKIYSLLMAAILVTLMLPSCDLNPESNNLITEDQLDAGAAEGYLNTAYRNLHSFGYYGQQMMVMGDVLADNADIANNTGRYVAANVNQIYAHYSFWATAYAIIGYTNLAISAAEKALANNELSQEEADQIIGQALFIRALCHFDIARAYGYEPGLEVGGFDLSAVIRDEPVFTLDDAAPKARSTNREVYDFVISDLERASILLDGNEPSGTPYRAGKAAVQALLARVLLYRGDAANGDFAKAVAYADSAMANTDARLSPFLSQYYDNDGFINTIYELGVVADWLGDDLGNAPKPHPESVFELDIDGAKDWSTVDGVNNSLSSLTNNYVNGNNFSVKIAEDLQNALAGDPQDDVRQYLYAGDGAVRKWLGNSKTNADPNCRNIPVIRYAELLLIKAEAALRNGDVPTAQAAVDELKNTRYFAASPAPSDPDDLFDAILAERRREFAFEGQRFFDLKRLGLDISKDGGASALPYSDFKVLAPLSNQDVITSGGVLVQNPGYN